MRRLEIREEDSFIIHLTVVNIVVTLSLFFIPTPGVPKEEGSGRQDPHKGENGPQRTLLELVLFIGFHACLIVPFGVLTDLVISVSNAFIIDQVVLVAWFNHWIGNIWVRVRLARITLGYNAHTATATGVRVDAGEGFVKRLNAQVFHCGDHRH